MAREAGACSGCQQSFELALDHVEGPAVPMSVHSKTFKNCFALSRSVSYVSANGGDPYHHSVDTIERQFLRGNDALQGIVEKSVGGEPRTGCVQELTGGLKPRISYHLDEILTRTAPQTLQPKVKNQTPQNAS